MITSVQIVKESFSLSARETQLILKNPHVQMGFEAEMILPVITYGKDSDQAELQFKADLKKTLGGVSQKWQLVPDLSIQASAEQPGSGIELVSTPAPLPTSLAHMHQLFELMKEKQIATNITTGLHVGVSVKGMDITKINKLKLLMLLDENFVSDAFDRTFNTYTQSHVELLRKQISQSQRKGHNWTRSRVIQDLTSEIEKRIDLKKHRTVNFSKLQEGYLEFRIMGNEDYHKQFDMVQYFVIRYAAVLLAALDPLAFEKEYQLEVARLVASAVDHATPQFKNIPHKYSVLGAGANTTKHQQLYDRFMAALDQGNMRGAVVILSMLIKAADAHADVTQNAKLINAAAQSYRLLLVKHLHMSIGEFRNQMIKYNVDTPTVKRVIHYLRTY
jgi:hypothetical protein